MAAVAAVAADPPLIEPKDLVTQLAGAKPPTVLYVGPNVLYRSRHIRGSIFAGPGNRPDGLELLKTAVTRLPRNSAIVIYCGCCPWDHCPNVKPAFDELKKMGYGQVKVLYLPISFKTDWIDHSYPSE